MQTNLALLEEVRADAAAVQDKADSAESALTSARHQLAATSDELACSEGKVGQSSYTLLPYALSEASLESLKVPSAQYFC